MGKVAAGVGTGGLSMLAGSNPLTKALGVSGDQGDYFHAQNGNAALGSMQNRNAIFGANSNLNQSMRDYGSGKGGSFQDAINNAGQGFNSEQSNEVANQFAINPLTGSRMATEQVQNNPMLGQLYGKGGTLDRTAQSENELSHQGFQLQPQDHEAYGQASGNIARMFGQGDESNMQNLAARGLASAGSGTSGAMFSGAQGNKNEMLAQSQMDIANQRMQNTTQRLGQTRNFLNQMSGNANQAIGDQFNRQLSGVSQQQGQLAGMAGAQTKDNTSANDFNLASQQDQRGAKGHTLMQGLGNGLFSSANSIGTIPGKMASSAAAGPAPTTPPAG